MASAATLRSAARALWPRRPLEHQGWLLARRSVGDSHGQGPRLFSSYVPTERQKRERIYARLSDNMDRINEGLEKNMRMLEQLEAQMKESKHGRPINLTPAVVLMPAIFLLFELYKYVQG